MFLIWPFPGLSLKFHDFPQSSLLSIAGYEDYDCKIEDHKVHQKSEMVQPDYHSRRRNLEINVFDMAFFPPEFEIP